MEQLLAEGYVEGKVGSGTYVAAAVPDTLLETGAMAPPPPGTTSPGRELSRRGRQLVSAPVGFSPRQGEIRPFRTGVPALDLFPWKLWLSIEAQCLKQMSRLLGTYADPAGYWPLRQAIADHLQAARAVQCEVEQVIIVAGSAQALDLVGRVLLDPGDAVWVEEPGYPAGRAAFTSCEARLVPVPVDTEGLVMAVGMERDPEARLAYVTPSHQYPLGVTMSLTRRLALLGWASMARAWVLEDDYDSEYRYAGRPLASLQGLDRDQRVLYTGTFSKVLFPTLRLGYLVVPPDLVDVFCRARTLLDRGSPVLEQAVVATFISGGHLARHLRRMRTIYGERQEALIGAAQEHLAGLLDVLPQDSGMHLVGSLPSGIDDCRAASIADRHNVEVSPLSAFALERRFTPGLVLGYAAFDERHIGEGVRRLGRALEEVSTSDPWATMEREPTGEEV